jgi:hypothetical protein
MKKKCLRIRKAKEAWRSFVKPPISYMLALWLHPLPQNTHTHTQYANPAFTPLHHPYLLLLFPALKPNSKEFYY